MVQVWQFDNPNIPQPIADAAYRGGDEDWVIAAPVTDRSDFEFVAGRLDTYQNGYNDQNASETEFAGEKWLVYTVCHA